MRHAHFLFGLCFAPMSVGSKGKHGRSLQAACLSLPVALKAFALCSPPENREKLCRAALNMPLIVNVFSAARQKRQKMNL